MQQCILQSKFPSTTELFCCIMNTAVFYFPELFKLRWNQLGLTWLVLCSCSERCFGFSCQGCLDCVQRQANCHAALGLPVFSWLWFSPKERWLPPRNLIVQRKGHAYTCNMCRPGSTHSHSSTLWQAIRHNHCGLSFSPSFPSLLSRLLSLSGPTRKKLAHISWWIH